MIWANKHSWWNTTECRVFPKGSIWPPVLDLHCGEERNKRHKNVSWRQKVTLCFEFPAFCQAECSVLFKCKFSIGESFPSQAFMESFAVPIAFMDEGLGSAIRVHSSLGCIVVGWCFLQHQSKAKRSISASTTDWFGPTAVSPNHLLPQFTS